jgi:hypothetical protein
MFHLHHNLQQFHVINGKVQHPFIMGVVFPFGGRMLGNTFVCILQLGVQRGVSIGGCLMLKKNC